MQPTEMEHKKKKLGTIQDMYNRHTSQSLSHAEPTLSNMRGYRESMAKRWPESQWSLVKKTHCSQSWLVESIGIETIEKKKIW